MAPLRLAVLFLACATAALAVEVRFVPATAEGTVSLGIYDEAGKLVRVLCDEWPIERFTAGLNGLSTDWDGKDSSGQAVPSGTYRARGFVAGDVSVEGVALHFNDWLVSDAAPRIASVCSVALVPGGDLVLAARLPGGAGALLRYSPAAPEPIHVIAPIDHLPDQSQIAVAGDRIFLLCDQRVRVFDLSTGKEELPPRDLRCESVSAQGDRLAVRAGAKIEIFAITDWTKQSEYALPDVPVRDFALLEGGSMAVVGEDGSLWFGGPEWKKIELPAGASAQTVAGGRAGTLWVSERMSSGAAMVAQYSAVEGRLAEWASGQNGQTADLAASGEDDHFCVIIRGPGTERTVSIKRNSPAGWGVMADKTITDSKSFGLVDGKLSASSGAAPLLDLSLNLQTNPLDATASTTLAVRAVEFSGGGTGLATTDGLPLIRVTEGAGGRLMVVAGPSVDEAHFYRGDGVCVEEYKINRLGNITSFDAGTIEMEGGAEKPAPPEEEIPEPSP